MAVAFRLDKLLRVKISQAPEARGKENASVQFLNWCLDNDVIPARGGGGGTYYFYMEDAKKVRKYLRKQGWQEVESD